MATPRKDDLTASESKQLLWDLDAFAERMPSGSTGEAQMSRIPDRERDLFRQAYITLKGIINGQRRLLAEDNRQAEENPQSTTQAHKQANERCIEILESFYSAIYEKKEEEKLRRTLKRLKEKGYYEEYISHLCAPDINFGNCSTPESAREIRVKNLLSGLLECGAKVGFQSSKTTDDEWMKAIEAAVMLHHPDDILDDSIASYAIHLKELIDEIRIFVVFIHIINSYDALFYRAMRWREKTLQYDSLAAQYKQLINAYGRAIDPLKEEEHEKEIQELQAAAERQKREYEKKMLSLQWQIDKMQKEKERLTDLWENAMEEMEKKASAMGAEASESITEQESAQNDELTRYDNVELPEKNVLFLGGWPRLVRAVKQRHPNWLFINSGEDRRCKGSTRIDYVVFFYGYISHKLVWRVYSELRDDVKTIFVSQKNEALMELEIKKGFACLQEKQLEEAENQ